MAENERTPLLQTVPVAPPRERYPHATLRRVCTFLLSTVPIVVFVAFVLALVLPIDWAEDGEEQSPARWLQSHLPNSVWTWPGKDEVSFEDLQKILLNNPEEAQVRAWSEFYTSGPHLAGQNLSQAIWTKDRWQEFGVPSSIVAYDVYLNYPLGHRLALLERNTTGRKIEPDSKASSGWKVKYEAVLEEDVLDKDGTSGLDDRIPTFHGYSASGNVTGPYVFANYGTYQDFEDLVDANVSLAGHIALVKYGGIFRGLKVKRAQELGMIGVVMYSDPGDDGFITQENGYKPYPNGPARQPSSVQRGSVQYMSIAPGDPTTPGYPSKPGVPRQPANHSIPSIPSLPISYLDAIPLLKALNGHGPNAASFSEHWHKGGLGHEGVDYNIGPSPNGIVLNLVNEQEYVTTPMWNVIGIINGTLDDEVVILGNHRDAWIAGGAGDPNSGSAAMVEVVRSFGIALAAGWKPLRTIVFASWDGEEYGLVGSTEWVEEYLPWLSKSTVAYLNVDIGTSGSHFMAAAAPLLNKVLLETTRLVQSPNQTAPGQTVGDLWTGKIRTMGSGSDFTAFQDFAGVPCVDMAFAPGPDTAIYHYHSNYDSFDWMSRYGDPGFHYHTTMAKLWSLLAAKIIESPIIPFSANEYALSLWEYYDSAQQKANATHGSQPGDLFAPLTSALIHFQTAAISFDARAEALAEVIAKHSIPWWKWWEKLRLFYAVRALNSRYKVLERQFLYAPGLDGRSWFKHVIFAPGLWTGYSGATLPGIIESAEKGDWESARRWVGIVAESVWMATRLLQG